MFILTQNNVFHVVEWSIFAILAGTSGFFMREVIQNYFSKATSFKMYDEKMEELPAITFCPLQEGTSFEYGKDFEIKYSFDDIPLMERNNKLHHENFDETVAVQSLSTYPFENCFVVSSSKNYTEFMNNGENSGLQIFNLTWLNRNVSPEVKIIASSKSNVYGAAILSWLEGDVMIINANENHYKIGLTLTTKKQVHLKDTTDRNDETVYECLESAILKLDLSLCPSKCLFFSLPNQKFSQCKKRPEKECSKKFIDPLVNKLLTNGTCKKSSMTFDIHGTIDVEKENKSQLSHEKLFYFTIAAPGLMKVSEEYLIYDFIGVVASIGGTLGLFIGFSFSNVTSYIVKVMKDFKKKDPANDEELLDKVEKNKEAIRRILFEIE